MREGTARGRTLFERSHWPRIQLISAQKFDDIASRHRDALLPGDDVGQVGYMSRFRVVPVRGARAAAGARPRAAVSVRVADGSLG